MVTAWPVHQELTTTNQEQLCARFVQPTQLLQTMAPRYALLADILLTVPSIATDLLRHLQLHLQLLHPRVHQDTESLRKAHV